MDENSEETRPHFSSYWFLICTETEKKKNMVV